jgi:hypothetical protein
VAAGPARVGFWLATESDDTAIAAKTATKAVAPVHFGRNTTTSPLTLFNSSWIVSIGGIA